MIEIAGSLPSGDLHMHRVHHPQAHRLNLCRRCSACPDWVADSQGLKRLDMSYLVGYEMADHTNAGRIGHVLLADQIGEGREMLDQGRRSRIADLEVDVGNAAAGDCLVVVASMAVDRRSETVNTLEGGLVDISVRGLVAVERCNSLMYCPEGADHMAADRTAADHMPADGLHNPCRGLEPTTTTDSVADAAVGADPPSRIGPGCRCSNSLEPTFSWSRSG